jgi:glutaconate CoA-transferase subunit A
MPLADAMARNVTDGMTVALEGFTHLIPFAAGHELIRQGRRDLTLVRMTPDLLYDQLIGMGCASRLIFSYGGNPGVGSLHRFRDAVEHGWPAPLEIVEHSHAGMANAYLAGAGGLPFAVLRGYAGTDLARVNPDVAFVDCPFTGERLSAVRAVRPDVTVIHAQRADRDGNVQLWGLSGVQKRRCLPPTAQWPPWRRSCPSSIRGPTAWSCRRGRWTRSASSRVARTPPTPRATPPATTPSTRRGTPSPATATTSWRGCASTSCPLAMRS